MKRWVVIIALILVVAGVAAVAVFVVVKPFDPEEVGQLSPDIPLANPPSTSGTPFMPIEPGVYFFDVTREGRQGTEEADFLEPKELEPGVFEQTAWVKDDFGFQGLRFGRSRWYPNGSYAIAGTNGVGEGACFFEPPMLGTPHPLKVGDAWKSVSRCRGDDEPTRKSQTRVVGKETVNIGGEAVETFVLEFLSFFEVRGAEISNVGTSWYSPSYRLTVKAEVFVDLVDSSSRSGPSGSSSSSAGSSGPPITRVLRSTQPS